MPRSETTPNKDGIKEKTVKKRKANNSDSEPLEKKKYEVDKEIKIEKVEFVEADSELTKESDNQLIDDSGKDEYFEDGDEYVKDEGEDNVDEDGDATSHDEPKKKNMTIKQLLKGKLVVVDNDINGLVSVRSNGRLYVDFGKIYKLIVNDQVTPAQESDLAPRDFERLRRKFMKERINELLAKIARLENKLLAKENCPHC